MRRESTVGRKALPAFSSLASDMPPVSPPDLSALFKTFHFYSYSRSVWNSSLTPLHSPFHKDIVQRTLNIIKPLTSQKPDERLFLSLFYWREKWVRERLMVCSGWEEASASSAGKEKVTHSWLVYWGPTMYQQLLKLLEIGEKNEKQKQAKIPPLWGLSVSI